MKPISQDKIIPVKSLLERSDVPFHLLIKPVGPSCNLACRYCYYPQLSSKVEKMDELLLESFIFNYINSQPHNSKEINFVWQGGEPLMAGIGFYKKAINFQQKYTPKDVYISNSLQTNGTLINNAWCKLFKEYDFIIGISLDGNKFIHDLHRPNKHGNGSYDDVIKGIKLLSEYNIEFNLLVVVHDGMISMVDEIYENLINIGAKYIQFQPLMFEGKAIDLNYSLKSENWGEFMVNIYNKWKIRKDFGKIFIMNIEHIYAQYFTNISPTCVHSQRCGTNLAMEPNGNIYACDHLINQKYFLANFIDGYKLKDSVNRSINMNFGKKNIRPECLKCDVKIICQGGCPAHIDANGFNKLCKGYYVFFSEVISSLKKYPRNQLGLNLWKYEFNLSN